MRQARVADLLRAGLRRARFLHTFWRDTGRPLEVHLSPPPGDLVSPPLLTLRMIAVSLIGLFVRTYSSSSVWLIWGFRLDCSYCSPVVK